MFQTINPATNQPIKSYEVMSHQTILEIAKESHTAFNSWKHLTIKERSIHFQNLASILRKHQQEYATTMTNEMGKTITESLAEVEKCATLAETLITKAPKWLQDQHKVVDGIDHIITFEPLGPIFIIMPWNYPFWQPIKVALPHIIAGNTIILKHARNVTGSSLALENAFKEAGFPSNIFQSIISDHTSSKLLLESDNIAGCSLTGSVNAGSTVAAEAGKNIKKTVLELGGSDPHIILEDYDLEKAAEFAVKGRTSNTGQVCIGSKRFIVHESIAKTLAEKIAKKTAELKIGDPLNPETQIGPLVNHQAVSDMEEFVEDAKNKGAIILTGGKKPSHLPQNLQPGAFFEPTVITNTTSNMRCVAEETFGPIAPIITFKTDEEAIQIANNTEFGLGATIWTSDIERATKIARHINAGGIFINSTSKSHPLLPIGGIKKSGYGRELSEYGIKEFVNIKAINIYKP